MLVLSGLIYDMITFNLLLCFRRTLDVECFHNILQLLIMKKNVYFRLKYFLKNQLLLIIVGVWENPLNW